MQQGNSEIISKQFSNAQFLPEVVKLLDDGHSVTLNLRGFSMRPFLEDNRDKAILRKVDTLRIGDPALAEVRQGVFVLHRIVSIDTERNIVTLRGDGNIGVERCRKEDVKGIAVGFYRKGRNRLDSIDGHKWKIYSAIWTRLFPIRRYLLFIYRNLFV